MDAAPSATDTPVSPDATATPAATAAAPVLRWRRALPWVLLIALLAVAQTLLVLLTVAFENTRAQDDIDAVAGEAAAGVRSGVLRLVQSLQTLAWETPSGPAWRAAAGEQLRAHPELRRIEWRDAALAVSAAFDSPFAPVLFAVIARRDLSLEVELACVAARRTAAPSVSRSYFVPLPGGLGLEVADLCVPVRQEDGASGFLVATVPLQALLEGALARNERRRYELSFVEGDGARVARAGMARGAGVYVAERVVDLPGHSLQLRADSIAGRPSLIPNLATALVLGLSLALFAVVLLLARDVRRRARAEAALAEAFGLRKAMEDSLSTGLRARDMQGRVTYANPAFCAMVGFTLDELLAAAPPALPPRPPYWPPEHGDEYAARQRARLAGERRASEAREGYETVFMRKSGERFPVIIYEAPLRDGEGRQTGWMSAVVDLSAQRRVEELSRQQQERLQATARLATVGEMASLMSHELNQPLAAIAGYASGSLNLLDAPDAETPGLVRGALERIEAQAERAGRVIKSVHDFVRRREQSRESLPVDQLVEDVLPLVRMQARKSGTRVEVDLPAPPAPMPRVLCDRTMVEQVLLNLTRNGIQAMESDTPPAERLLVIRARAAHGRWVRFEIADAGPGIAPEVAARLFTPLFTTRAEGMGLGLSLCRTVVEQHAGALDFVAGPEGRGTVFRFTLPVPHGGAGGSGGAGHAGRRGRGHGHNTATQKA